MLPLLWRQLQSLVQVLPSLAQRLQEGVSNLAQRFLNTLPERSRRYLSRSVRRLMLVGRLSKQHSQVFSLLGLVLYLVLVPITVFAQTKTD